nr:MAG TPA: hypothetical protein [Caudoviricetes sp.]
MKKGPASREYQSFKAERAFLRNSDDRAPTLVL